MLNSENIYKIEDIGDIEDIEDIGDSVCQIESSESDTTQILSFNIPTKNVKNAKIVARVGVGLLVVGVPVALMGVSPVKIIECISRAI